MPPFNVSVTTLPFSVASVKGAVVDTSTDSAFAVTCAVAVRSVPS